MEATTENKGGNGVDTDAGISAEQAMAVIKAKVDEQATNCKAAIDKALTDFGCTISVAMLVTAQGNEPVVRIEPKRQ